MKISFCFDSVLFYTIMAADASHNVDEDASFFAIILHIIPEKRSRHSDFLCKHKNKHSGNTRSAYIIVFLLG